MRTAMLPSSRAGTRRMPPGNGSDHKNPRTHQAITAADPMQDLIGPVAVVSRSRRAIERQCAWVSTLPRAEVQLAAACSPSTC